MRNSNSLTSCGGRHCTRPDFSSTWSFQSTPSSRRETRGRTVQRRVGKFQSTPSSRRETPRVRSEISVQNIFQSTPSSRRETYAQESTRYCNYNFNPLPPRGGRHERLILSGPARRFQSTPSSRRETFFVRLVKLDLMISIHSLLAEGDPCAHTIQRTRRTFQSTPSSRRETVYAGYIRMGARNFNPLPPRGGRR